MSLAGIRSSQLTRKKTSRLMLMLGATALLATGGLVGCSDPGGSDGNDNNPGPVSSSDVNREAADLVPEAIRDRGYLNVATTMDYPPYSYQNESGDHLGADYDLMVEIIQRLDLEAEWVNPGTWGAMVPGVQSGRFDVIVSAVAILEERLESVSFISYVDAIYAIQVHTGNPKDIDANDLCGVNIGTVTGSAESFIVDSVSEDCVAAGKPALDIASFSDGAVMNAAILAGQVDAQFGAAVSFAAKQEQVGGALETIYAEAGTWPGQLSGIGLNKEMSNEGLGKAMEMVLVDMQEDGTFAEIMEKNLIPEQAWVLPSKLIEKASDL